MGLEFCLALVPWGAAGLVWSNSGSPNPWKLKSSSLGAPGAVPSHQILQGQDQDRPSLIFFKEFSRFEDSVAEMGGGDRALCVRWCLNPLGAAFPGGDSCCSDLPSSELPLPLPTPSRGCFSRRIPELSACFSRLPGALSSGGEGPERLWSRWGAIYTCATSKRR